MTDIDLAFACEMYFNLEDPVYQDYKFDEFNVRLGNSQLDFDRERRNSLSRALVIYKKLWNEFDHNQLNIESCIKEITGLRIEESLFLSYFFALSSQKGYFRRVDLQEATKTDKENSKIINALSPLKQKIFIDY
ncbi:hypothetical protein [Nodosilinea nodulosa]|uniref:hypothetical protein n=1 Tax=Nodosilinea nodulosa TaxID=416001 RepID=UPI0012D79DC2|nr:hypothetical protein [Nodosilinea nodulosa]